MFSDGATDDRAETVDVVDDTGWNNSFLDEFSELESRWWCLLGSFEDESVTGGDCGCNLLNHYLKREVPSDDLTTETNGLVEALGELGIIELDGLFILSAHPLKYQKLAAASGMLQAEAIQDAFPSSRPSVAGSSSTFSSSSSANLINLRPRSRPLKSSL